MLRLLGVVCTTNQTNPRHFATSVSHCFYGGTVAGVEVSCVVWCLFHVNTRKKTPNLQQQAF